MNIRTFININGLEMNLLYFEWRIKMNQPFTGTIEDLGEQRFLYKTFMDTIIAQPVFYPRFIQ